MMPDHLDPSSDSGENPAASRDTSPDSQDSAAEEKEPKIPIDHHSTKITETRTGKRSHEELMQQEMLSFPPAPSRPQMQQVLAPRVASFPTNPLETVQDEARPMDAEAKILSAKSHGRNTVAEEPSHDEFALMSRSERKKFREKKRRSDVNKGFDELMSLLVKVDPTIKAEMEEQEKCKKNYNKASHSSEGENLALNRVDLISRTVTVIARMYRQNEDQKALIAELTQGGEADSDAAAARQAIKDNRVLIMIPFLAPVGPELSGPGAHDSSVASSHHPAMRTTQGYVGPQGVTEEGASYQMPISQAAVYHAQQQPGAMPAYETVSQGFRSDPASAQRYFHNMHDGNAMAMSGMGRSWQANMGREHGWMM